MIAGDEPHRTDTLAEGQGHRTIDLAAVEAVILGDPNLDDWQRDQLLTNARSVAEFLASREPAGREN